MTKDPKVYIIILNWNSYELTRDTLLSLESQSFKQFKTILIDNGSEDNSHLQLKKHNFSSVEYLRNDTNKGFSAACNQGIKIALDEDADYILLLNNDTIADKRLIEKFVSSAEKIINPFILTCKISYFLSEKIWYEAGSIGNISFEAKLDKKKDNVPVKNGMYEVDFITGCCMFLPKKIFNVLGFLDERFFFGFEDVDYCLKALHKGIKQYCIDEILLQHKISSSIRNWDQLLIKHKPLFYYSRIKATLILIRRYSYFPLNILSYLRIFRKILKYYIGFGLLLKTTELKAVWKGITEGLRNK